MSHTPHKLDDDFPEMAEKIDALKASDAHFARLVEDYAEMNDQVHKAESNLAPMEELAEMELRKKRMALKDEIYRMLTAAA